MSTTVSLPNVSRSRVVAATGALVAAAAATVTLAVSGGGDTSRPTPSATPAPSVAPAPTAPDGLSGADRFHHFR